MFSGGRDSTCLLDVAVALLGAGASSRCTSTTACARRPTPTSATAASCASALGRRARGVERADGSATGPTGGRRATCRPGPATCATARPSGWRGAATRVLARRAHRHRSGRDDPLPARRLAGPPRAARDARRARACWCARCSASRREQTAAYCRRAGLALARGREQRRRALRPQPACATVCCPALRGGPSGGGGERAAHRELLREETELLDGLVDARARRAREAIAIERLRELPRALARLVVIALAEQAGGRLRARRPASASRRSSRSAAPRRQRPSCTSAGSVAAR